MALALRSSQTVSKPGPSIREQRLKFSGRLDEAFGGEIGHAQTDKEIMKYSKMNAHVSTIATVKLKTPNCQRNYINKLLIHVHV